jgi:pyridoxine 5-phosphate synthase
MTELSVNVNKIATLRNARGKDVPNVLQMSRDIVRFGAAGITVHPRPDGRHIRTRDVLDIGSAMRDLGLEFNIEGYPTPSFMQLIERVKPAQCTLVPDPPDVLTSNAGWRVGRNRDLIAETAKQLQAWRVRSSFFIEPGAISRDELEFLRQAGAGRIELYTESYAEGFTTNREAAIRPMSRSPAWRRPRAWA